MRNSLYPLFFMLALFMAACAGSDSAETASASNPTTEFPASSSNKLPDAVVKINIKKGGNSLEELNFTLPGQKATTQAATASYQKASGLFSLLLNGKLSGPGAKLSISGGMPALKEASYDIRPMDANQIMKQLFCTYTDASGKPYVSKEGTFDITRLALFQDIGVAAATYFMDGNLSIQMVSPTDPADVITLEGTVRGINTVTR